MKKVICLTAIAAAFALATPAYASSILDEYRNQAQQENPSFNGFSAERGKAFFLTQHATGKAETPACTSCHTNDPTQSGLTRAGKSIAPLAVSVSPDRYTDQRKVEKWFRRNCNSVLGRACTTIEKGDFITFMQTQ
ncbi:MAG: DUF1924 domain-containing protein [Methylocystaceae bacterium]|nr:DUF1924 domain-containing protein [Methylocystaceae bacterium]